MTFSICVRETYEDEEGATRTRYGVAVTTRLAGVGRLCPFASANGAVAIRSFVNVDLGRRETRCPEGLRRPPSGSRISLVSERTMCR